jgi:uncharacterized protein (DUF2147 family)
MKMMVGAAVAFMISAGFASVDPVLGTWKTEVDDGNYAHVEMSICGDKICGVIAQAFNAKGPWASDNQGKNLICDMVALGGGSCKSGKIWQPSTDKVFNSKMSLSGVVLNVSGCVAIIRKKTGLGTRKLRLDCCI